MTALADEVESVVNYHVTALTDVNEDGQSNLTMLYQVKPGTFERLFACNSSVVVIYIITVGVVDRWFDSRAGVIDGSPLLRRFFGAVLPRR